MGTGRRKNGRSELNLLHNHLNYPSYALLTLLSSSSLYKCLKEGMAKKNTFWRSWTFFTKDLWSTPGGEWPCHLTPPPFHIQPLRHYQPPAEFTEPPSLCMLASPLQLLQQMRRIFCQMYQSASCLSREERATPGRGGERCCRRSVEKKEGRRRNSFTLHSASMGEAC